ncbi:hypothetical protein NW762_013462 [Fusarium torreyae]|uniref:Glucose-methanol-choline oxidoreductase C-terminal domain-containing protein n=1 Tax=Fusarium torreyae TaxID=1237075 RepID=A0A9W8RP35_9HYPO|nr:hypothetical protein NW762_013462 [Fusarium torreyae]
MDHLLHLDTDVVCLLAKLNSYDYIIDIVTYLTSGGENVRGYSKTFRYLTDNDKNAKTYPEGNGDHEVTAAEIGTVNQKLNEALKEDENEVSFGIMPVAAQFNAPAPYKFAQGAYSTTLAIINRMYANDQYLSVLLNTEVIAVEHIASNTFQKSVHALKIRDKATGTIKQLDVGKAKVILSAGTIGTASIALNSGLQHLNPLVGKGLIDHNVCYVRFAKQKDNTITAKPLNLKTHHKVAVTINANFFLAGSSATLNTTHFYGSDGQLMNPTKDLPDDPENFDTICVLFEFVGKLDDENSVLNIPGLDPVLDIRRAPLKHEVQCAMEGIVRKVRDAFITKKIPEPNQTTYANPGVREDEDSGTCGDPGLRPQHLGFGVFSHECGTMRMDGPKGDGVVDRNLKVKGLDNLWVCDLSVFPVSPEANPSLTLAALSLRLAEHLSGKAQ